MRHLSKMTSTDDSAHTQLNKHNTYGLFNIKIVCVFPVRPPVVVQVLE
jgi:hypothetical protein